MATSPSETEKRDKRDINDIISDGIRNKEILRVRYLREDSVVTDRKVEPFDLAPIKTTEEIAFWGWCLDHDRYEMRKAHRIISVEGTGKHFDPIPRLRTFKTPPKFTVTREW